MMIPVYHGDGYQGSFLWEHPNVKTDLRWTDDYRKYSMIIQVCTRPM